MLHAPFLRRPSAHARHLGPAPVAVLAALLAAAPAPGQSINVDFGTTAGVPGPAWAGAGRAGTWNAVVPPAGAAPDLETDPIPLLDLDGDPLLATLRIMPAPAATATDDPLTTGDEERLLDDYLPCPDGAPITLVFEHLVNDTYEVVTYAWSPGGAAATSVVLTSGGADAGGTLGGAWPGALAPGVTHVTTVVEVTNGRIVLDISGAAVNGVQIVRDVPPGAGDCDLDHDGNVGMTDLAVLLGAWGNSNTPGHGCDGILENTVCPGDIDRDGHVGFGDLTILLAFWGADVQSG